jgi:teichuronic acid biosynthesis glycosyltransferase TuaG
MPLVSVVTPVYRAAPFVGELVRCLLDQTFTDFEWICIDDCSPDDSIALIEASRGTLDLKVLRMERNVGPSAARNAGLRVATGRYVAFLDADDLWLDEKLERQVRFMIDERHTFTFHDYRRMSADGSATGALVKGPGVVDWAMLHKRRGLGCLTVMLERTVVPEALFPERDELEEHFIHEDFVAWSRLLLGGGKALRLPADLARYRIAPSSRSASTMRGARSIWHIYRVREKIPLIRCIWYFLNYVISAGSIRVATRPERPPGISRARVSDLTKP